jgi:type I restriction enzyme M protein
MDREKFTAALDKVLKGQSVSISVPVRKAILAAFSERDEDAAICKDADGDIEPDPELRDTENVPLKQDIHRYFDREVKPHVPGAWIDEDKTRIGYEIPLTRHFYKYKPPRPLEVIEKEIRELEGEIMAMLAAVAI